MHRLSGTVCVVFIVLLLLVPGGLVAQDGPGGNPGGVPGGFPVGVPATGGEFSGTGTGNSGDSTGGQTSGTQTSQGGQAEVQDLGGFINSFNIEPEQVEIENQRLQPFVGPSRANMVERGFSHPRSQIAPSTGGAGGGGRGGGGGAQTQDGFEVVRAGIRARLVPNYELRLPGAGELPVSTRFQQRLSRLPVLQGAHQGIQVSHSGRTIILNGSVSTLQQKARIERMAALEPGVSAVENNIIVEGE